MTIDTDKTATHGVDKQLLANPPANHNPLIGMLHVDTMQNIYDALSLLELVIYELDDEGLPSSSEVSGYCCLMRCVRNAVKFEIEHRPAGELRKLDRL